MKKLSITLILFLGIGFIATNCINGDDDFSSGGGNYTINIDSFSIELAAYDQESHLLFDSIEPVEAPVLEQVFFNTEVITEKYAVHEFLKPQLRFGSMAFARAPDQYNSGITDLIITSSGDIHTTDSMVAAGVNLTGLCIFDLRNQWIDADRFLVIARNGSHLGEFSLRIPVALEKPIDQYFTFTFVHKNGDSVSAISPRVLAK